MKKDKKPKRKPGKLPTYTFFSMLIFFSGLIIAGLTAILLKDGTQAQLRSVLLTVGGVLAGVGLILVLIAIAIYRYYDRHPELAQPVSERVIERVVEKTVVTPVASQTAEPLPEAGAAEVVPDGVTRIENTVTYVGTNVQYIPSMEAYEFINMGIYQSLEEKFDQISKMDHTQFIIYVAKLFSRKGYQVKLTPVVDNYAIDLIVEKMGVTIAVGCLLTNKVLCKEDVVCVRKGKDHYHVQNCMALTNMYFDRTALEYAREEKMSLVDRNILAEDFMN